LNDESLGREAEKLYPYHPEKNRITQGIYNYNNDQKARRAAYLAGRRKTIEQLKAKDGEIEGLLSTLASIKQCCEATGKPMDLIFQSIWNQADKAERGYNEQSK